MKVYSPSQTKNFLACPMKWALGKQGWVPKIYNKGTLYAIRGTAVSAGLDAFNQGAGNLGPVVAASVREEWNKSRIDQREWVEFKSMPFTAQEIIGQAIQLVETYVENPPVVFKVLHSEYVFKEHGWARADVIGQTHGGKVIPIDYKCKDAPINDYYRHTLRQDYKYDWQLMHYCWAVSEEFKTSCLEFGIVILWYDKKPKIEYVPFAVNPERLANWYLSACDVWERMEACETGAAQITEVANHRTQFGACEFSKACLEYNRDESLMHTDYLFMPRR